MAEHMKLEWGLQPPPEARTAYGARAIQEGNGYSIVRDRQHCWDADGDMARMERLVRLINEHGKEAQAAARKMRGDESAIHTLVSTDEFALIGDCRGSHGYIYLGAWLKPPQIEKGGTPDPAAAALVDAAAQAGDEISSRELELAADIERAKAERIPVALVGGTGNAFGIIGACRKALRRAGYSGDVVTAFTDQAQSGDYDNVLATAMEWFDVC